MYRPRQYAVDAKGELCRAIRAFPFATIAVAVGGRVEFAYAPIVLDENNVAVGRMRFHLARANPVANLLDGNELLLSFRGPDGYVSPDWYASEAMVPTWNYIAVEARGRAARLKESQLRALLADLSAQEEAKLATKTPWTLDKIPVPRLQALVGAIVGFSVRLESLDGKFKLSQEKEGADFDGAVHDLEARGDASASAVASAMRRAKR